MRSLASILVVLLAVWNVNVVHTYAQLQILLTNNSVNGSELEPYRSPSFFRSSNIDYFEGFIHQPEPRNACSYIEPLPSSFFVNNTQWVALVTDYPSCPDDMVVNVRNAGYGLILTSSVNDSVLYVTRSISNGGFPFAVITAEYAAYLRANALSDSLSQAQASVQISVTSPSLPKQIPTTGIVLTVFTVFIIGLFIFCTITCFFFVVCCSKKEEENRLPNRVYQVNNVQAQRQERLARQQLIENILRQFQELQVDLSSQVPLGRDEACRLPLQPYHTGEKNNCESCAICVDEFNEGESLRWLPCAHAFHPQCIDEWLTKHSALCPLCKAEVPRSSQGEARRHPAGARLAGIPIPS